MKKDFSENEFCCKDEAEAQEGVVMQQSCRRCSLAASESHVDELESSSLPFGVLDCVVGVW